MKITILVEAAETPVLREVADGCWAAQKDNITMSFEAREALRALSSSLHAEASRLEKKNG